MDSLGRDYTGNGMPVSRSDPASGMQNAQKDLPGGGLVMGVTDPTLTAFPATLTSANWKALRVKFTHHFPGTLTFNVVGTDSGSVAIYRVVSGVATKTPSIALALDENINDEIFQIHTIPGFTSSVKITAQFVFDNPYSLSPNYPYDEVRVSAGGSVLSIVAQIPTTPAMTPTRNGTTNPNPTTRAWPSRQYQPPGKQATGSWTSGDAIVLIQGSATSIPLVATRDPNFFSVRWTVQRNTTGDAAGGDNADNAAPASLGPASNLTVTPDDPTGQTAHLSLDSIGSFSVICYIDTAGTGVFDPSVDSAKYWNVIVAQVTFDPGSDASDANPADDAQRVVVSGGNANLYIGSSGPGVLPAISLEATTTIVCAGANGQLGANRLHVGWCQN